MNEFLATKLFSITVITCLPILVIVFALQCRHKGSRANCLLLGSSVLLLIGYLVMHVAFKLMHTYIPVSGEEFEIRIDARLIVLANTLLSTGVLFGTWGAFQKLREQQSSCCFGVKTLTD